MDDGKKRRRSAELSAFREIPPFCPKCRYPGVTRFKDGKVDEIKMPDALDAVQTRESVCAAFII